MERKDWVMLGGFVGTILTMIVVFFAGLQTMNSRFEAVDRRFEAIDRRFEAIDRRFEAIDRRFVAIENRLLSIEEHLRGSDATLDDAASVNTEPIP
ncbi:MAG: hypothetical protein OXU48_03270 [candidate division Zixibacteria bacterium]|nr:hypothetical protein [candidate division Zixibacteria bacterium]